MSIKLDKTTSGMWARIIVADERGDSRKVDRVAQRVTRKAIAAGHLVDGEWAEGVPDSVKAGYAKEIKDGIKSHTAI